MSDKIIVLIFAVLLFAILFASGASERTVVIGVAAGALAVVGIVLRRFIRLDPNH